jgi:hypothetical protein
MQARILAVVAERALRQAQCERMGNPFGLSLSKPSL